MHTRVAALALVLLLVACAGRRRSTDQAVDPRLLAMDTAWQERQDQGLRPLETMLDEALRKEPDNPDFLWRQTRFLIERGLAEEQERRVALNSYAQARGQAIRCLNALPAWRSRNDEVGLAAALEVVDPRRRPCVVWGAFAWARWAAMMGGDAAALDLDGIDEMASWSRQTTDVTAEVEVAQWTAALVDAIRPEALAKNPDKSDRPLKREVDDHPNDLARRWDLLVYVAIPEQDTALTKEQRSEILKATARTKADRAIQARVEAME